MTTRDLQKKKQTSCGASFVRVLSVVFILFLLKDTDISNIPKERDGVRKASAPLPLLPPPPPQLFVFCVCVLCLPALQHLGELRLTNRETCSGHI